MRNQNEKQFADLYGANEWTWSKTTCAGFAVLFKRASRQVASSKFGVSKSAIGVFLKTNDMKHKDRMHYSNLNKPTEDSENG